MISQITYGTLSGGSKNGIIAYELIFDGSEPTDTNIDGLVEIIQTIRRHPGAACRKVHFTGTFPIKHTDAVFSLLVGFRAAGFKNIVTLDGQHYFQWLNERIISATSIHLKKPAWVMFPFDELIFDLNDANLPEPEMPETYNGLQPLYINRVEPLAMVDVFTYIHKAKQRWNINAAVKQIKEKLL